MTKNLIILFLALTLAVVGLTLYAMSLKAFDLETSAKRSMQLFDEVYNTLEMQRTTVTLGCYRI